VAAHATGGVVQQVMVFILVAGLKASNIGSMTAVTVSCGADVMATGIAVESIAQCAVICSVMTGEAIGVDPAT